MSTVQSEKMHKQHKWTPISIIGLLILCLFAVICVAPFIYMLIMSFTQSTTLMIPGQVTMIPVFIMMNKMNLLNTYFTLIVLIINAFGVFLIRQFIASVPNDLPVPDVCVLTEAVRGRYCT